MTNTVNFQKLRIALQHETDELRLRVARFSLTPAHQPKISTAFDDIKKQHARLADLIDRIDKLVPPW